jgi:hypothetical protein
MRAAEGRRASLPVPIEGKRASPPVPIEGKRASPPVPLEPAQPRKSEGLPKTGTSCTGWRPGSESIPRPFNDGSGIGIPAGRSTIVEKEQDRMQDAELPRAGAMP